MTPGVSTPSGENSRGAFFQLDAGWTILKVRTSGSETYQDSAGERLGGDHDAGPVFDRSHPSHLAGRDLLLLITLRPVCRLIIGRVDHFLGLLKDTKSALEDETFTGFSLLTC